MSCDEAECGSIKLPTAEYSTVRKAVIDAYNKQVDLSFDAAEKVHAELVKLSKGMRKPIRWDALFEDAFSRVKKAASTYRGYGVYESPYDGVDFYDVVFNAILRSSKKGQSHETKLYKPMKKDFKKLPAASVACRAGIFASVRFDPKGHVVIWNVSENNHAVRDSREHSVARALFKSLSQVKWCRATGGVFLYSNEFDRDHALDNEGSLSRVTGRYGPLGEAR